MPTFNHITLNDVTMNLDVTRQGWNDGVLISLESPVPTSWEAIAGDDAEIAKDNWDGAAIINGTLEVENITSSQTLYIKQYNSVYATFVTFPIQIMSEVSYESVAEFSVSGVTITFNFGGALSPITATLSESVCYRQIPDTESWGSEHERKLFIPYQNPVP